MFCLTPNKHCTKKILEIGFCNSDISDWNEALYICQDYIHNVVFLCTENCTISLIKNSCAKNHKI